MEDSVRKETERAVVLMAPGPHAILLLVPVNQFTEVGSGLYLSPIFGGILLLLMLSSITFVFLKLFLKSKKNMNVLIDLYSLVYHVFLMENI